MNVNVDLEARENVPRWLALGTPIFTVLAALLVGAIALVSLGVSPIAAYSSMFVGTVTSEFGITQTLIKAVPLILTGLAVYVPLKGGLWNIGAEGQLYMGAIAGTWLGLNVDAPMVALLPLMLLGAGLVGGLWGAIPGYLRAKYGVNEIIVTLMLTFVGVRLAGYLVRGPMRGGEGNFPVSAVLPGSGLLPSIPGTAVHVGILVALLVAGLVYVLFTRMRLGFEITLVGSNPKAAEQAGMSTVKIYMLVLTLGGALAGLAGVAEIAGVQERLRPQFSPGYGFTAIPIALLGRNGAFRVTLAALFFALLYVGGSSMEVAFDVPAALIDILQALIILFLITAEFFKRYRISVGFDRSGAGSTAGTTVEEGV